MLPSKDGLEIIHSLRENNIRTPTIMLSTKGETKDKVSGFKSGADDYLPILAPRLTEKTIKRDIEQLKIENRVERIGSTGKKVIGK